MFKALISGFLLSFVVAVALSATVGPINHEYTSSVTRVTVEGRLETFQIRLPDDRIVMTATAEASGTSFPEGLSLPYAKTEAAMALDVYRLRDANDKVIGLASRLAGEASEDWMIFIAARGAMYLSARERLIDDSGHDVVRGEILDGSRLMKGQTGAFSLRSKMQGDQEILSLETVSARQAQ